MAYEQFSEVIELHRHESIDLSSPVDSPWDGNGNRAFDFKDEAEIVCLDGECSVNELCQLTTVRGTEARDKILADYGGVHQLCQRLRTDPQRGLSSGDSDDLTKRRLKYGTNYIKPKPMKKFLLFVWEAWCDVSLIILSISAVVSLLLAFYRPSSMDNPVDPELIANSAKQSTNLEWIDGVAILIAVVVVVTVTAFNDWSKEVQFRGLKKSVDKRQLFTVVRDSQTIQIPVKDIVVGDICVIEYGDMVPADGIVIQGNDVRVDESSLTGESELVKKFVSTDPILLSGTFIMEGSGRMVVIAVGLHSQAGNVMKLLGAAAADDDGANSGCFSCCKKDDDEEEEAKSVLKTKLDRLAVQIGKAGIAIAVLNLIVLILYFSIDKFVVNRLPWDYAYSQRYVDFVILSITILVIAIPEGLPVAVMVSLAYSVKKMMNDNNLVRHLYACETMGNATAICSDKTGTLTTNRMTVVEAYVSAQKYTKLSECRRLPTPFTSLLATSIAVNTGYTSRLIQSNTTNMPVTHVGNKTECALLGFTAQLGYDYELIRQQTPESDFTKVLTFNSNRKWMATVIERPDNQGWRVFAKGASEILLQRCRWIVSSDTKVVSLSDDERSALTRDVILPMASNGLRTICLAFKDYLTDKTSAGPGDECVDQEPNWDDETEIVSGLTCLCLVGIEDPVRPEVTDAIKQCQSAGITVRMVTGDNVDTARSIALKCGILTESDEDGAVLEGPDFNRKIRHEPDGPIDQSMMDEIWPKLRVLARSSPEDKYNLVKGIMNSRLDGGGQQEVVAVTGDGTNDAPALRKADVGFAMNIAGTDIAKEACDIILLDDNFASIVKAVVWGRHVYDSIAKFLQFQLTVNVVAVTLAFISSCVVRSSPINAVQMMWVNLLQDTLASLSLATEQPSPHLLQRRPYGRNQSIVTPTMLFTIIFSSAYQLSVLFSFVFKGNLFLDIDSGLGDEFARDGTQHYTFVFNVLVMMTLFNQINARKIDGSPNVFGNFQRSHLFHVIWIGSFLLQIIIIQFGGVAFSTIPLTLEQWFWSLFFGMSVLIFRQILVGMRQTFIAVQRWIRTVKYARSFAQLH